MAGRERSGRLPAAVRHPAPERHGQAVDAADEFGEPVFGRRCWQVGVAGEPDNRRAVEDLACPGADGHVSGPCRFPDRGAALGLTPELSDFRLPSTPEAGP